MRREALGQGGEVVADVVREIGADRFLRNHVEHALACGNSLLFALGHHRCQIEQNAHARRITTFAHQGTVQRLAMPKLLRQAQAGGKHMVGKMRRSLDAAR